MLPRSFYKVFLSFLIWGFVCSVIISGCLFPIEVAGITPTPITPSPTERICPPNIELPKADALKILRSYIVVLYDQDDIHDEVLEYQDKTKTSDVKIFISKVLPKLLGPGDHYSIFRLGVRTYESARIDRQSSEIQQAPDIPPAPKLQYTLTQIPTIIATYPVSMEIPKATNSYIATLEIHNQEATQVEFENNCMEMQYDSFFKETATQWSVTQQAKATEFSSIIADDKDETLKKLNAIQTPYSNRVVYEGLSHVTIDFTNECSMYDRCILILFDSLDDWRNEGNSYKKPDFDMDLKNVEIVSIMPSCVDIFQPSCKKFQDVWSSEFSRLGGKSVLYLNGDNLEKKLLEIKGGN